MIKTAKFDHSSQAEAIDFIRTNIGKHKQFALGTVDGDGKPWVVSLNLAYDERFNIIWKSEKNTLHSQHIALNPEVAICIFSEDEEMGDFGFYAKAKAHEVTDMSELEKLISIRFTSKGKETPDAKEFLGDSTSRLYLAKLDQLWLNDESHEKIKISLEEI